MIPISDLTRDDPVFSYHSLTTGEWCHIAAKKLADYIDGMEALVRKAPANEQLYQTILISNGVERKQINHWKLQYILADKPHEDIPFPILIEWEEGTHTLADGNHRFCALYELGMREILVYLVPPSIWRQFQVDMPPKLQAFIEQNGYMDGDYSHLRK